MRPRLRRLLSLWRQSPEPIAAPTVTDEIAAHDDAERPSTDAEQSRSAGATERRLADAHTRLKQSVPPKQE